MAEFFEKFMREMSRKLPEQGTRPGIGRKVVCGLLCLFIVLYLAGCGGKTWRKGGTPGTKAYTVRGKTYRPLKSAHGFVEEGLASWYGPGFHGKKNRQWRVLQSE